MATDKNWAKSYLIDPLTEPEPSDMTGPGTHFGDTMAPASKSPTPPGSGTSTSFGSKNPFRNSTDIFKDGSTTRSRASSDVKCKPVSSGGPSPPYSGRTPPQDSPYRQEAFSSYGTRRPQSGEYSRKSGNYSRKSGDYSRTSGDYSPQGPRSRGNSLNQRPLEAAKYEAKLAHRSPHLKKNHIPGPDKIDRLDVGPMGRVHHEGPYDAVLLARNTSLESSPVAAVQSSNREAIRATPRENIRDSLEKHKPLDGTAGVPPGTPDRFGRTYEYKEGDNMQTSFGGDYKRWPDVKYHPDDIKGKGEPSYSIEKALKEHKINDDKDVDRNGSGIELQDHHHGAASGVQQPYSDVEPTVGRSASHSHKRHSSGFEGLKKRFGSLRRSRDETAA